MRVGFVCRAASAFGRQFGLGSRVGLFTLILDEDLFGREMCDECINKIAEANREPNRQEKPKHVTGSRPLCLATQHGRAFSTFDDFIALSHVVIDQVFHFLL